MPLLNARALVLGGGGASGNAWLIGVIAGLFDGGVDVSAADRIIGTSAGSTAAAQITSATPAKLYADIRSAAPQPPVGANGAGAERPVLAPARNHMETTGRIIDTAKDADEMRRKIGAAALGMDGSSDCAVQTKWRATVAARLPSEHWPQQSLLITAVDAYSGRPVVFNRHSGVSLVDAVAASTAGGFAFKIGHNHYIDGGYRADVNADLAAKFSSVLIIPPLGTKTRKPLGWHLGLDAQVGDLRAGGSKVEIILPDCASQSTMGSGMALMDLAARRPSAEAGYYQGKALADKVAVFWR